MNEVTIRYGLTKAVTRRFGSGYTIADLLSDRAVLANLSAPEGCAAVSDGETLEPHRSVSDYSVITLEKQASKKQ